MPTDGQSPFYEYLGELNSASRVLAQDLSEAMEARRTWRTARSFLTFDRSALDLPGGLGEFEERADAALSARPRATIRATGILVVLQSLAEGLRRTVIGDMSGKFGPEINGVAFSELLQASANSCRHGSEWWRTVTALCFNPEFLGLPEDARAASIDAILTKDQRRSIHVLVKALGTEHVEASNQPAIDALSLLSDDGSFLVLRTRMFEVAMDIARSEDRVDDFNGAAQLLNVPTVKL